MTAAPSDTRHADPDTRLVAIAHPRDDIEAQLITNLLADAGIEAMVTGGALAGFRAEAPANVCVVVRGADAEAASEALAAVRPTIDDSQVGDDSPADTQAPKGRALDVVFPAALLDFVIAFGMLALLWLVWQKRRA
jgi:hypothetical protein